MNFSKSSIAGNKAINGASGSGGGIWINNQSQDAGVSATLTDILLENNQAFTHAGGMALYAGADTFTFHMTGGTVSNNLASQEGGGFVISHEGSGNLTFHQSVFSQNTANGSGGGISAAENSRIIMQGGTVNDNVSGQESGGIWNHVNSVTALTNGVITNNKAVLGNSIYNDSVLYMERTRVLSSGVYLANVSSIIRLVNPLTEASKIQMELSSYVTPNANGTPIVIGEGTASYPLLTQEDADAFLKPRQDFEGWEIQLNNDNTQVFLTPVIYLIQYENLCGAVNPNPASYTITTPTIKLLPPHSIAGYRFLSWFDAITGGNQIADIPQGSSGNITLYAR